MQQLTAIVLAAGRGTRMKSPLPKVLHPVAGEPMILRVIKNLQKAGASECRVVVGYAQNLVKQVIESTGVGLFVQAAQNGTADAVRSAQVESIEGDVIIVNGDHPLVEAEELARLVKVFREEKLDLAVVSCELRNPKEFGRVIRQNGQLITIVEARDASMETMKIKEINTGIYLVKSEVLKEYLPLIQNKNAKQEYYLTDLISLAIQGQERVQAIKTKSKRLAFGVNSMSELALANQLAYRKKLAQLMDAGVMVLDPGHTYVEESVEVGSGTVIYPNVHLRGRTRVGSFVVLEPGVYVTDSTIGDSTQVRAGTYIEKSKISAKVTLGPFARLRPETEIAEEAHIGNFVELKKVKFGKRSKAGHLTYLGDADVGDDVNVGCGTITCNYAVDKKKYKTKIGDRVFIGSDSQFVAPVEVGNDAIIGSGSTITKDVPPRALGIARAKQANIENYADRVQKDVEAEK